MLIYIFFHSDNSNSVLVKQIQHTETQTDYKKLSTITSNKMVQTRNVDSNIVDTDNINMEIRTIDECLTVYKTQVKLFITK